MKLIIFLVNISVCFCAQQWFPSFIEPCHMADSQCLYRSAKKAVPGLSEGIPSLGINSMDPLQLDRVQASNGGLNMDFKNTVVKGLRNCEIVKIDLQSGRLDLALKCSIVMIGNYNLSGQLLIMPIEGSGKYRIRIRDMLVKVVMEFGEVQRAGNRYWTIKNWHQQYNVQTGADFKFQNLFNGNKQLADAVHEFANNNWREIFQELAPPIVKEVISTIVNELGKFFDKLPVKDLLLD